MRTPLLALAAVIALAPAAPAQQPQGSAQPPAPCMAKPESRRFDFWVGDWNVFNPQGKQVGTSHVERVSGGCALLENWRAATGQEGKSLNAYNASTGQWQQFWVGQYGLVSEYRESTWEGDTSVSFISRVAAHDTAAARIDRLTFSKLADGSVRQHDELSTDGGATWVTQYDYTYRRRS